jgi:hypothetical protein
MVRAYRARSVPMRSSTNAPGRCPVASAVHCLARSEMGGPDFVAAVAATLDGGSAVLAVAARDATRVERMRSGLGGVAR